MLLRRLVILGVALGVGLASGVSAAQADYVPAPQSSWVPNGTVWAIATTDTRVYLGGEFTALTNPRTGKSVQRHHLVALNRSTGAPIAGWNPDLNGRVLAIDVAADETVYAGGDFTEVGTLDRSRLAAFDADGETVAGWDPVANNRVWDLAVDGSDLFVVGNFGRIDGQSRPGAARLDRASGALESWNAQVGGGRVQALALAGGTAYLAGTFASLGGEARPFAGAVDTGSGAVTGWNPAALCDNCRVRDLAVAGGRVLAAVGGEPGGRAVAWSTSTAQPIWTASADGEVQAVAVRDGVAYFGGHFAVRFNGAPRSQLAAADAATGAVLPLRLTTAGSNLPGVWALDAQADALRVGGGIALQGVPQRRYLVLPDSSVVPPYTSVTLVLKGCAKCKVKVAQARAGGGKAWKSTWRKARAGRVTLVVPSARTQGMTFLVKAPWEKRTRRTTEVVVKYAGQPVGSRVRPAKAASKRRGSACWVGTTSEAVTMRVLVRKARVVGKGGKMTTGSRAWTPVTRNWHRPMQKTRKGVLSVKVPTRCQVPT